MDKERAAAIAATKPKPAYRRGGSARRSRFDIDHGELPSRQVTVHQIGTSYLWIGSTGKLIEILNPGDAGYEENAKIVSAALHPERDHKSNA